MGRFRIWQVVVDGCAGSGCAGLGQFRLQHVQRGRCISLQFAECTCGSDLPLFQYDDSVYEVQKRTAERMGNDEDGASYGEIFENSVDDIFTLGVNGGGGFVENQNTGISDDGSSEGDALSLATGEFSAFFADDCLITVGQQLDESGRLSLFGCLMDHLGGGSGISIANVFVDGVVEQECFLSYEADLTSEVSGSEFADIDTIDQDLTFVRIHKAGQQAEQSGLPGSISSDDSDYLTESNIEADVFECEWSSGALGILGVVAEIDITEGDE